MKLSISLSTLLLVLPALVSASSVPSHARGLNGDVYMPRNHARHFGRQRQGGFRAGGNRGGQNGGLNKNKSASSSATTATPVVTASSAAATTTSAAAGTGNQNKNGGNSNKNKNKSSSTSASASASTTVSANTTVSASATSAAASASATVADNNNDPNTSTTLLSNLVETGLANDGQNPPVAGQVASLTTTNNFINFCAGKTITNGQQVTGGSCNPIPLGDIIPKANMPSCKFASPANQDKIPANQAFTIKMNINNMQAGVFTNAQKTYYMAPQQLNGQGIVIGHSHFVIQKMGDFADPSILDAGTFAFFKGINTAAQNGQLTADVTAGLPAGNYRLASINTDANHAPVIAAVAQHGWLDDIVYFTAE